jgi:hypothetical protein
MATGGMDDGVGGSGAKGCMNLPFVGMLRCVKGPKAPRRLGAEIIFTSSERVGGAEGVVGGSSVVDGCADISEKWRATTRSLQVDREGEGPLPTDSS